MLLQLVLQLIALAMAHELVAPDAHIEGRGEHIDDHINELIFLLGMFYSSDGIVTKLPDGSFTASFTHSSSYLPSYSRIGGEVSGKPQAWCGKLGENNELVVDLTTSHLVTGVATQGRGDHSSQWVTDYAVETSENGYDWVSMGDFVGNFDSKTMLRRRFGKPVLASFVKFTVLKYQGHPSMRIDVLVYDVEQEL